MYAQESHCLQKHSRAPYSLVTYQYSESYFELYPRHSQPMTREQLLMYLCRCSMSRGPCLRRLCSEGQPHRPSSCQKPTCIPKFFAKVMKKEKIRDIVHNALLLLLIAITSEIRNLTVKRPEKPLTNETLCSRAALSHLS